MIIKHVKDMVEEANQVIEAISAEAAIALYDRDDVSFIDIRDIRELWREGKIEGAYHAPRGMLEWWVDPKSPYYKEEVFSEEKKLVFY